MRCLARPLPLDCRCAVLTGFGCDADQGSWPAFHVQLVHGVNGAEQDSSLLSSQNEASRSRARIEMIDLRVLIRMRPEARTFSRLQSACRRERVPSGLASVSSSLHGRDAGSGKRRTFPMACGWFLLRLGTCIPLLRCCSVSYLMRCIQTGAQIQFMDKCCPSAIIIMC